MYSIICQPIVQYLIYNFYTCLYDKSVCLKTVDINWHNSLSHGSWSVWPLFTHIIYMNIIMWSCPGNKNFGQVICLSDLGNILAYYLDKTTLISLLYWVSNCPGNMPKYYSGKYHIQKLTQSIIINSNIQHFQERVINNLILHLAMLKTFQFLNECSLWTQKLILIKGCKYLVFYSQFILTTHSLHTAHIYCTSDIIFNFLIEVEVECRM